MKTGKLKLTLYLTEAQLNHIKAEATDEGVTMNTFIILTLISRYPHLKWDT